MNLQLEDLLTDISFRRFVLNPNQGDSERWKRLINADQVDGELIAEARQIITEFYNPLSPEEFESEAIEFRRRINVTTSDKKDIISLYDQRRSRGSHWFKYAAAIIFLITSVFSFLVLSDTISLNNNSGIADASELIEKTAKKGQKKTIFFPDGTKVKLNSVSKIIYPVEFNSDKRIVTLEGEAYFEVAHHDDWPFIVITNDVETEVLGTSFNVNNYAENGYVSIALVEGSVKVQSPTRSVMLEPMQMMTFSAAEKTIEVTNFDYIKVAGWKDNILKFEKASFEEVEFTLERWFDIEFVYEKKPVFEGGYTLDFEDESLESIMEGISSNKFEYEINGKKVLIN